MRAAEGCEGWSEWAQAVLLRERPHRAQRIQTEEGRRVQDRGKREEGRGKRGEGRHMK